MKEAIWETSPGALADLINGGSFVYCHLYTLGLAAGAGAIRITDADLSVTNGVYTWDGRGVRIDRERSRTLAHWKRGLDVDNWLLVVLPRTTDEVTGDAFPDAINGVPWVQAARQGALDGADVQVDRAYFEAWPSTYQLVAEPVGILTMFAGTPAEVDCGDNLVAVTLNDYRELLNIKMPRHVYQAGCRHTLFDAGCTLGSGAFAVAGTAIGGTTRSVIQAAPMGAPGSGTFQLGKLQMVSGLNSGFSRTIMTWSSSAPGQFTLLNPLPFDVMSGDQFVAYPGCDKTVDTCTLFGNIDNYGGQPGIPQAETAI